MALVAPREPDIVRLLARALSDDEWRALPGLLDRHGMLPLGHARLVTARVRVPPSVDVLLLRRRAEEAFNAEKRRSRLLALADVLAPLGTPLILYKGAAYGAHLYDDPGLRPMGDVDLLVPEEAGGAIDERLRRAGFKAPHRYLGHTHEAAYLRPPDDNVDLHTALNQRERNAIDYRALFARSRPSPLHAAYRLLDPIDELIAHVVHQATHELCVPLQTFADLALLTARVGDRGEEVAHRARDYEVSVALNAVAAVAEAEMGIRVPGADRSSWPGRLRWPSVLPSAEELVVRREPSRPLQLYRKALLFDRLSTLARFSVTQVGLRLAARRGLLAPARI
jgi:hypothetical protein